eukprot:scaffold15877_cov64-Phaeocystis_antarctica.AAC.1
MRVGQGEVSAHGSAGVGCRRQVGAGADGQVSASARQGARDAQRATSDVLADGYGAREAACMVHGAWCVMRGA